MNTMSEDMWQEMNAVKTRLNGVETKLNDVDMRLTTVEKTTRNIAIVVAGHTDAFVRIEKQLTKLDELDGIKKCLEKLLRSANDAHGSRASLDTDRTA